MNGELLLPFPETGKNTPPRDLLRFPDPKNDNERLLNYQYEWLVHQDAKAWEGLWILSRQIARRMILTLAKKKGFSMDPLTLEDKADDAIIYILRRYQRGWYVRKAYHKAIKEGVIHAIWHRTKAQKNEVLMDDETISRLTKEPAGERIVLIEGMTTAEAVAKIRAELLPEIAERILREIPIIGGKK